MSKKIVSVFLLVLFSFSAHAVRLQELGNDAKSLQDKVYLDLDSIIPDGQFRIATIVTIYPAARVNSKGITIDRHSQKSAFDCQQKQFSPIVVTGYLENRQIGSGPETTDWKSAFKDIPSDLLTQRAFSAICSNNVAGQATPSGPGAQTPVIPSPRPAPGQPSVPPGAPSKPGPSSGTGIAVNSAGYVLTNNHVVKSCKRILVKPLNGQPTPAFLEVVDSKNDLALLRTSLSFDRAAVFRSQAKAVKLGEAIGVVGYPLSGFLSTEPKATFGQINSVAGMQNDYTLLQISAPVQPGNSGGPVLDEEGTVVGVVVSQASLALAALTGNVPQNINFAIRSEIAQLFLNAHRIDYTRAGKLKPLKTDEIAEIGSRIAVHVSCLQD